MGLYTIGHSTNTIEYFVKLLKKYEIDYLLDVRSVPYSKYMPQFNKENIREELKRESITYFHMGKYFGARQEDDTLYHDEGYLDFDKVRAGKLFQIGMKNVEKGLAEGHNIDFMCTEKDPMDCHRTIMVARGFELDGVEVKHILKDGNLETQEELNNRLLAHYFPKYEQLDIFSYTQKEESKEERLIQAYRIRNKELGYRKDNR